MSDRIRIYVEADTMDGKPGWWSASCDIDGDPAYDASGRSIEEALARLAQELADELLKAIRMPS